MLTTNSYQAHRQCEAHKRKKYLRNNQLLYVYKHQKLRVEQHRFRSVLKRIKLAVQEKADANTY